MCSLAERSANHKVSASAVHVPVCSDGGDGEHGRQRHQLGQSNAAKDAR